MSTRHACSSHIDVRLNDVLIYSMQMFVTLITLTQQKQIITIIGQCLFAVRIR